ncbi:hypothetical protein AVEN_239058-1 [Araneus ventricosus]|uniref:Reverse transcriptase RNase H-like domain-containing protein n=1 Tax=Araneus ventricosus TaxID=182803 RepID=A0A4Y2NMF3_ARAVE|nr:hypothetical protein AVEN_239058-1 [Araneus ventricosus]
MFEEDIKHLEIVLQRIQQADLTIKQSKCKFAQSQGHIVGLGCRRPSELKIEAVKNFPIPRTKTDIRAFLGLTLYYSHYIPMFSTITAPLADALKGKCRKGVTDASDNGIEVVLSEVTEDDKEHPIVYLSRKFSDVEKRYCCIFSFSCPAAKNIQEGKSYDCTVLAAMFRAGRPAGAETWFWAVSLKLVFLPQRKRSERTWVFCFGRRMLSCGVSRPEP